jgi:hypothetical protein
MPRLKYVGPSSADDSDVVNRLQANTLLNAATVNRTATTAAIETAAGLKASKKFVDDSDAAFATADYYQTQDLLNVPTSAVGVPNGVASLVAGKVPLTQLPVLGDGYLRGPFGPTSVSVVTNATTTAVKLAEFAIGVQNVVFHPLAYASVVVDTTPGGRPILEMRISNGAADYAAQTLIAQGIGRPIHTGKQVVALTPASDIMGATNPATGNPTPAPWGSTTNTVVSLYVYSFSSIPVSVAASSVISAAVYLMRMRS